LARGIELIEWTFDPLMTKNAYFNFMRLGATARRYLPNIYGITTSPLHASLPTDRLVAEWQLRSPRVMQTLANKEIAPPSPKSVRITIPHAIDELKSSNPAAAIQIQTAVRENFTKWFAKGYLATRVVRGDSGMDYILERGRSK
jgi:predicted GNAT superfamily acetyltransferase